MRRILAILTVSFLLLTTLSVAQANQPPVADPNGPYTSAIGVPLTLDGSGSYDPDGFIVMWEWDLDGDGEYDDASGETVTHTWSIAGTYVVGLRVTDEYGESDAATATVTIIEGATITAHKFHDLNANELQDEGEEDIAGWLIEVYVSEDDGATWSKVAEGLTGPDGAVTFDGLPAPKLYKVVEEERTGWINTTARAYNWFMEHGTVLLIYFGNMQVPTQVIPEVPLGTIMASATMIIALIAYASRSKWRRKPI